MTISLNYTNNENVSSPAIIISGRTSTNISQGIVQITNDNSKVFPPQHAEVNGSGNFKILAFVAPDTENNIVIEVIDNGFIDVFGFPQYSNGKAKVIDKTQIKINFVPLQANKTVHLCLIMARDSPGTYDMPSYRLQRGERATLEEAIRKLKVAGRLMQAYTNEEMRAAGFSNRCFQFAEEETSWQQLYGYNVSSPTPHKEVKIHILRSPKTVEELRNPEVAQQNPNGSDTGWLFSHASDVIKDDPILMEERNRLGTGVQCAVIYLDAHYDVGKDMILAHAALGGGDDTVKLAIFGSHGLHSWPINMPQVGPSFLDCTHLSQKEVANDAGECGTSWECFNVTLGAFMHETGHLLGCPHQVSGVMLRDYVWFNRSFMTREGECIRTGSKGMIIPPNGMWDKVCHWNKLDIVRYLYHGSFGLPVDDNDPTFGKVFTTTLRPDESYGDDNVEPIMYFLPHGGVIVRSQAGIFMIEFITQDLARYSIQFYPRSYGGSGLQKELVLDYDTCSKMFRDNSGDFDEHYDLRILSLAGDLNISDFKKYSSANSMMLKGDFGLNKGVIKAYKSILLGESHDKKMDVIGFEIKNIRTVRIFHGYALDGIQFHFTLADNSQNPPKVPARNYFGKFIHKISDSPQHKNSAGAKKVVTIGNEKHHYSDFTLNEGEYITKFHFRNGAWIDAVQFETSAGRKSPMFGNASGGHLSTLESPAENLLIIGMYGYLGTWLDGIGIVYAEI